ncbi:MAG: HAD hydrolase-like protein, partial [Bacteroidales bacterium]|nr:HAD hydrolase-like protein [Bacteroidales bacterium]
MYIIFDFDGTLADTFALGSKLINEYADRLGYKQIDFAANKDKSAREL